MKKTLLDYSDQWHDLCDKIYPLTNSSEEEKVWYFAQILISDVENGGIISFFYNYGADDYAEVIKALDKLGAGDIKELLQKVAGLFPDKIENLGCEQRNEAISNWPEGQYDTTLEDVDEKFYELQASFEEKILKYIHDNRLVD